MGKRYDLYTKGDKFIIYPYLKGDNPVATGSTLEGHGWKLQWMNFDKVSRGINRANELGATNRVQLEDVIGNRVCRERLDQILESPERLERVKEMLNALAEGPIPRPGMTEELDLRTVFYYSEPLRDIRWVIEPPTKIFVWEWNLEEYREALKQLKLSAKA